MGYGRQPSPSTYSEIQFRPTAVFFPLLYSKVMNLKPLLLALVFFLPVACKEGVAERAGEKIDRGVEKTGDVLEDVGGKTEDAVDKVN